VDKLEQTKVSVRAKLGQPFRVIRLEFGYVKIKI